LRTYIKQSATAKSPNATEAKGNVISEIADEMESLTLRAAIKIPSSLLNCVAPLNNRKPTKEQNI
jgi:hypothetical protein